MRQLKEGRYIVRMAMLETMTTGGLLPVDLVAPAEPNKSRKKQRGSAASTARAIMGPLADLHAASL
jgi:hypothetical protein